MASALKLLLTVQDTFLIEGRGLVLVPLLAPPAEFRPLSAPVIVRAPDKPDRQYCGWFRVEYFVRSVGSGCQLVLILPDAHKEEVPIGSTIWVEEETYARLISQ